MLYCRRLIVNASLICVMALGLSACQAISISELTSLTQDQLNRIDVSQAKTRLDKIFTRKLTDNLNQTSALRDLSLNTSLTSSTSSTLAIRGKSSNLSNTVMSVSYELVDKMSNEILTSGKITSTATSGTVTSYYGQDKSKQFAAERLAGQLADRLSLRLRRYFLEQSES